MPRLFPKVDQRNDPIYKTLHNRIIDPLRWLALREADEVFKQHPDENHSGLPSETGVWLGSDSIGLAAKFLNDLLKPQEPWLITLPEKNTITQLFPNEEIGVNVTEMELSDISTQCTEKGIKHTNLYVGQNHFYYYPDHPSFTPGDGSCGLWALLQGLVESEAIRLEECAEAIQHYFDQNPTLQKAYAETRLEEIEQYQNSATRKDKYRPLDVAALKQMAQEADEQEVQSFDLENKDLVRDAKKSSDPFNKTNDIGTYMNADTYPDKNNPFADPVNHDKKTDHRFNVPPQQPKTVNVTAHADHSVVNEGPTYATILHQSLRSKVSDDSSLPTDASSLRSNQGGASSNALLATPNSSTQPSWKELIQHSGNKTVLRETNQFLLVGAAALILSPVIVPILIVYAVLKSALAIGLLARRLPWAKAKQKTQELPTLVKRAYYKIEARKSLKSCRVAISGNALTLDEELKPIEHFATHIIKQQNGPEVALKLETTTKKLEKIKEEIRDLNEKIKAFKHVPYEETTGLKALPQKQALAHSSTKRLNKQLNDLQNEQLALEIKIKGYEPKKEGMDHFVQKAPQDIKQMIQAQVKRQPGHIVMKDLRSNIGPNIFFEDKEGQQTVLGQIDKTGLVIHRFFKQANKAVNNQAKATCMPVFPRSA